MLFPFSKSLWKIFGSEQILPQTTTFWNPVLEIFKGREWKQDLFAVLNALHHVAACMHLWKNICMHRNSTTRNLGSALEGFLNIYIHTYIYLFLASLNCYQVELGVTFVHFPSSQLFLGILLPHLVYYCTLCSFPSSLQFCKKLLGLLLIFSLSLFFFSPSLNYISLKMCFWGFCFGWEHSSYIYGSTISLLQLKWFSTFCLLCFCLDLIYFMSFSAILACISGIDNILPFC